MRFNKMLKLMLLKFAQLPGNDRQSKQSSQTLLAVIIYSGNVSTGYTALRLQDEKETNILCAYMAHYLVLIGLGRPVWIVQGNGVDAHFRQALF